MLFLTQPREGFMSVAGIKSTTFTLAKQRVLTTTLLEASMWYKSYCHSNKTNRGITVLTSNLPRCLQAHQLCLLASKQKPAHYLTNTDYPSRAKMKKRSPWKKISWCVVKINFQAKQPSAKLFQVWQMNGEYVSFYSKTTYEFGSHPLRSCTNF